MKVIILYVENKEIIFKLLKNTLINFYLIIIALPEVDAENGEDAVDPDRYSPFFYLWIICSISSSLYAYTWDIKMDWGLLDRYLRICFLMSLSHPQINLREMKP